MKTARARGRARNRGAVMIVAMIFIVVFSALAVSLATLSAISVQLAENQRRADRARASAESGLEVVRYWLNRVSVSGMVEPSQRLQQMGVDLQDELTSEGITNIPTYLDGPTISIPHVTLDSDRGQNFLANVTQIDDDTVQVDVTGVYGPITRTIRVNYLFGTRTTTVFDFGVASKGPVSLSGNIDLEGVNVSKESDAYIESLSTPSALSIQGNSQIAGDVKIVNPLAFVDLQGGQAGIGGETGQAAIDDHVTFGVPPTEFPEPNPSHFESYATNIVDSDTDTSS
ncbi:MAG: hypothetical protein JSU70_13885, partial [Phycisphaerales bacterium]